MNQILYVLVFLAHCPLIFGQEQNENRHDQLPAFSALRAEEDYAYIGSRRDTIKTSYLNGIKYIPISKNGEAYLSFGGQIRPRLELFSNRFWDEEENPRFYSHRIAFHSNIALGKYFRVFVEFYHGYTSHEKEFLGYDQLNIHQGFAEFRLRLEEGKKNMSFRFGRQEMGLGAARLVGIREGQNIRRSFDIGRLIYKQKNLKLQTFYGKEVKPEFGLFDNQFALFDNDAPNPIIWGMYSEFNVKNIQGTNELYYLGFQSNSATFNDVSGKEKRHTIGLRRVGKMGERLTYNTELIIQFGSIGDNNISAFNIDTDWHFLFIHTPWKPSIGLKFDWSSGDRKSGDGKVNTFNPFFVNPAIYSLAVINTPSNLLSVHPSITLSPSEKLKLYFEWAWLSRTSKNDALYRPPRFIARTAAVVAARTIGNQLAFELDYEFNRNLTFELKVIYFIAGDFIRETGLSENILHFAPTLSFKF